MLSRTLFWSSKRFANPKIAQSFAYAGQTNHLGSISWTNQNYPIDNARFSTSAVFDNEVLVHPNSQKNNIKVYIKSFGCSHNMSDGEYMAGVLNQGGYTITNNKEEANLWYSRSYWMNRRIINTCTVRDKSIRSFERYYKEAANLNIPVIISGCMTEGSGSSFF